MILRLLAIALSVALGIALCLLPACGDDDQTTSGAGNGAPAAGSAGATPAEGGVGDELQAKIDAAVATGRAYLLGQQDAKGGFGDSSMKVPGNV